MQYLLIVGFISLLGQVVLLRELSVAFYGVELIYTLAMALWLFAGACGALISRSILRPSFDRIHFLFLLVAIDIPLSVVFIRYIRQLFAGTPGAYLPLPTQILAMTAAMMPLGMLLGLLFQLAAKIYVSANKSLAVAYAVESLGGLAGGIAGSLFIRFGFQNFTIAIFCSLAAAASPLLHAKHNGLPWLTRVSILVTAALTFLLWKATQLDRFFTSWTHPTLLESVDTPYSRVTVSSLNGQVSLFENDALLFDTESSQAEEVAHFAALQHPNPQEILVLGGGLTGIIRDLLQHAPGKIDYVELNEGLFKIALTHLPAEIQRSLGAQNVRIIFDDPRSFLKRASSYDLILVGMGEPGSGQANRFYTREFFQKCRQKLKTHGILAFGLRSSENYWTPPLAKRMISIYKAAKSAFPEVVVVPGGTNIVIASADKLIRDPSILEQRFYARKITARLVSPNYLRYRYTNDRFTEVALILASQQAPVNTDARPICYQYTVMIWLSKFLPSAQFWDISLVRYKNKRLMLIIILLALLLGIVLLRYSKWTFRRIFLAVIAGLGGMVLETILVLYFQIKNGILYRDVGVLLMGFMAGLAFGSFIVSKARGLALRISGPAALLGFAFLSFSAGVIINAGVDSRIVLIVLLLFLTGFIVGALFAYAGLYKHLDQRKAVSPLYSADLIGGCIGSIAASLLLVPLAGLGLSAYLMIPLAVLALLLV